MNPYRDTGLVTAALCAYIFHLTAKLGYADEESALIVEEIIESFGTYRTQVEFINPLLQAG